MFLREGERYDGRHAEESDAILNRKKEKPSHTKGMNDIFMAAWNPDIREQLLRSLTLSEWKPTTLLSSPGF